MFSVDQYSPPSNNKPYQMRVTPQLKNRKPNEYPLMGSGSSKYSPFYAKNTQNRNQDTLVGDELQNQFNMVSWNDLDNVDQ